MENTGRVVAANNMKNRYTAFSPLVSLQESTRKSTRKRETMKGILKKSTKKKKRDLNTHTQRMGGGGRQEGGGQGAEEEGRPWEAEGGERKSRWCPTAFVSGSNGRCFSMIMYPLFPEHFFSMIKVYLLFPAHFLCSSFLQYPTSTVRRL